MLRPKHFVRLSLLIACLSMIVTLCSAQPANTPAATTSAQLAQFYQGQSEPQTTPGTGLLPSRHALVIGIDKYQLADGSTKDSPVMINNLQRPSKDAALVGDALTKAGFKVTRLTSTDRAPYVHRNDILNAIEDLNNEAGDAYRATGRRTIVAVYFAGHGLSSSSLPSGNGNFIVPSDFRPRRPDDISEMALSVQEILARLGANSTTLRILILDACRNNLSFSLTPRDGGAPVTVLMRQVDQPLPNNNDQREDINNSYVLYSTLNGNIASDDGSFSKELSNSIEASLSDTLKSGSGERSGLPALKSAMIPALSAAGQTIEASDVAMGLRLFWTKGDFDGEKQSWQLASSMKAKTAATTLQQFRRELYCRFSQHLKTFTYYSYFYPEVKRSLSPDDAPADASGCSKSSAVLQSALNTRVTQAPNPDGDLLADKVARLTPSPTAASMTLIKDVVSASALSNLKGLDPDQPVDQLAIAVTDGDSFKKNDLVQVEKPLPGNRYVVKTMNGNPTVVSGAQINVGRSAIDFTIPYSSDVGDVSKMAIPRQLIDESVVADISVSYRQEDGPIAFTRAQAIASSLLHIVNNGSEIQHPTIAPSVRPASLQYATASLNDILKPGDIHVVMSVLPLFAEARAALPQFDSVTIPSSESVDAAFAYQANPAGERSPNAASSLNRRAEEAVDRTPIEKCLLSGASNAAATANLNVNVRAFVQIAKREQELAYNVVAGGLRRAGFTVPAFEVVEPSRVPSFNQVRYCANGVNASAAATALKILNNCDQGSFGKEALRIAPAICTKAGNGTIEIWLKQPEEH